MAQPSREERLEHLDQLETLAFIPKEVLEQQRKELNIGADLYWQTEEGDDTPISIYAGDEIIIKGSHSEIRRKSREFIVHYRRAIRELERLNVYLNGDIAETGSLDAYERTLTDEYAKEMALLAPSTIISDPLDPNYIRDEDDILKDFDFERKFDLAVAQLGEMTADDL